MILCKPSVRSLPTASGRCVVDRFLESSITIRTPLATRNSLVLRNEGGCSLPCSVHFLKHDTGNSSAVFIRHEHLTVEGPNFSLSIIKGSPQEFPWWCGGVVQRAGYKDHPAFSWEEDRGRNHRGLNPTRGSMDVH